MVLAYARREEGDPNRPAASGLILIGPEESNEKGPFGRASSVRLRLLSSSDVAELAMFAMGQLDAEKALGLKAQVRVKLIEVPLAEAGVDENSLRSGRLPEPGRDEILAGANTDGPDTLKVGGRSLKVVGVLIPDLVLFNGCYLIPPSGSTNDLFPAAVPSVRHATLVYVTADKLQDRQAVKQLEATFPHSKYGWAMPQERLDRQNFNLYVLGLAVFLLGGSGAIMAFLGWLAGKIRWRWLASPLVELKSRPRLVWGVHLLYFGLVIAVSFLIYRAPDVQTVLLSGAGDAFGPEGPFAEVGKTYTSGNILRAAALTFVVNFFLGTLLVITLPSFLVPGSGILVAIARPISWGALLAPTLVPLAHTMLPHSGTMLLEGEGYILAAIFGLLIPIHMFQRSLGGTLLSRWSGVLWLNMKGMLWVALVLAVAACYEATEVILMNR
jgi:hypothetical protein